MEDISSISYKSHHKRVVHDHLDDRLSLRLDSVLHLHHLKMTKAESQILINMANLPS